MSQWLTISCVALHKLIRDGELPCFDGMVTVDEVQRKRDSQATVCRPGADQVLCHDDRRSLWQTVAYQASTAPEVSVSTSLEVLEAEVLQLVPADRSHLLERLIASLDSDPEVEEAWEREADRRESELESGLIEAVPGQEAIARLRAKILR